MKEIQKAIQLLGQEGIRWNWGAVGLIAMKLQKMSAELASICHDMGGQDQGPSDEEIAQQLIAEIRELVSDLEVL